MPPRENKRKITQKSIGLTDLEWAIIDEVAAGSSLSNGDIIRLFIEDYVLLHRMREASPKITNICDLYYGRIKRKQDVKEIDDPSSKSLCELFEIYPSMKDLPELLGG